MHGYDAVHRLIWNLTGVNLTNQVLEKIIQSDDV
ncbi:MAG: hypothetical protein U0401_00120 [Anaerolineae bacterium]